jgi:hypothetical protein
VIGVQIEVIQGANSPLNGDSRANGAKFSNRVDEDIGYGYTYFWRRRLFARAFSSQAATDSFVGPRFFPAAGSSQKLRLNL